MKKNSHFIEIAAPVGVVAIIFLLVVPIPAQLLDFLIALNIGGSLLVLLTTMFIKKPLDFSVFPSLVLVFTLLRLGLNVASTRLVLRDGYAGKVINAFGDFVVGGSIVIGLVIFLILVVIQFVVVTNGAGRAAEVGARFTLDAMPGKQMAIDADLNAGLIDEKEARRRRAEVSAEADFYGAMDGGSKFVRGDAIAGIIITLINLIGGFIIGMVQHGMTAQESIQTYSLLTVGDGLVTQIPALLMSVATGLIVTRAASEKDLGSTAGHELLQSSKALTLAGVASVVLALVPGLPRLPFLLVGAILLLLGQQRRKNDSAATKKESKPAPASPIRPDDPERLLEELDVRPLEILLSPDIVDLVGREDDLLARVRSLRRKIALDLGLMLPPVRTRDSTDLNSGEYAINIHGVEVARGQAPAGRTLALGDEAASLPGEMVVEPVFGLPGKWIPIEMSYSAEVAGATVVDRASVLVTHLSRVAYQYAPDLLSREYVKTRTERLKQTSASVVDELIPNPLTLGDVQRVLAGLLAEEVPIKDLEVLYEAMAVKAKASLDTEGLVEACRRAIAPAIVARITGEDSVLHAITLDPTSEQLMIEGLRSTDQGSQIHLSPDNVEAFVTSLKAAVQKADTEAMTVVLVCSPAIRSAVRKVAVLAAPELPVLSYVEVSAAHVRVETAGVVSAATTASAQQTVRAH